MTYKQKLKMNHELTTMRGAQQTLLTIRNRVYLCRTLFWISDAVAKRLLYIEVCLTCQRIKLAINERRN